MFYPSTIEARFLDRPNRFIAHVDIAGNVETVHVKNTGRCKELLSPGVPIMLAKSDNPNRKTKYDLIAVVAHHEFQLPSLFSACVLFSPLFLKGISSDCICCPLCASNV